jgi:hypothetical protein
VSDVTDRKCSGHFRSMGLWGELREGETLSCVHCRFTWILQKGSGRARGYCTNCMGYVCGPACAECLPFERKIENLEAGRPENDPGPVKIFVPPGLE